MSWAAGISLQPVAFWPHQKDEKSIEPRASAFARNAATAESANGNPGAAADMGPSSLTRRFMIARAGRPVKTFVTAV